jgi:hypothetical protein
MREVLSIDDSVLNTVKMHFIEASKSLNRFLVIELLRLKNGKESVKELCGIDENSSCWVRDAESKGERSIADADTRLHVQRKKASCKKGLGYRVTRNWIS